MLGVLLTTLFGALLAAEARGGELKAMESRIGLDRERETLELLGIEYSVQFEYFDRYLDLLAEVQQHGPDFKGEQVDERALIELIERAIEARPDWEPIYGPSNWVRIRFPDGSELDDDTEIRIETHGVRHVKGGETYVQVTLRFPEASRCREI